jgi:hypothetical protein
MIQKIRIQPLAKDDPEMNDYQTAALSRLIIDHIRLARSRRETLGWLMASVLKAGSVNLNRLAPHRRTPLRIVGEVLREQMIALPLSSKIGVDPEREIGA